MHQDAMVQHLEFARSDHRPIILDTEYQSIPSSQRSSTRRFEAKWLHERNFRKVVEKAWENAGVVAADGGVLDKLELMHKELHDWDSCFLKSPKKRLQKAQPKLEQAMNGPMNDD